MTAKRQTLPCSFPCLARWRWLNTLYCMRAMPASGVLLGKRRPMVYSSTWQFHQFGGLIVPSTKRHGRRPARGAAILALRGRHRPRRGAPLRLWPSGYARVREQRPVRARRGPGHRHRGERDVHLRGPRRRRRGPSTRRHGPRLPRIPGARNAQPSPARAALLLLPDFPLRPPAGRAIPPTPPVRCGGHR